MNYDFWKSLEIRRPSGTRQAPIPVTKEQLTDSTGIATLFVMCSQALVLTTGVCAIASLNELGPVGILHNSQHAVQVNALAELAVEVAQAAEHTLCLAISTLKSQSNSSVLPWEMSGFENIESTGAVYISLLQNIALEMKLTVIQQELSQSVPHGLPDISGACSSETREIESSINKLAAQAKALLLRIEMCDVDATRSCGQRV